MLGMRRVSMAIGMALMLGAPAIELQGQYGAYRPGPWDAPPREYRQDMQRRGFQDGFEGARRDLENRRRPNVNNRDEFRNYRGPAPRLYREAFRRGYQTFWAHVRR